MDGDSKYLVEVISGRTVVEARAKFSELGVSGLTVVMWTRVALVAVAPRSSGLLGHQLEVLVQLVQSVLAWIHPGTHTGHRKTQ